VISFGSLFSGIGGFDLGFTRAGMECLWQVEIDSKCQDILRRNLPGAEIYSDVREVGKHNLKPVDVICGGFPCQDLSIAGRREGLAGERSGLWFEFHRIIAELRPGWVVIENVPGLLSSNGGEDFAVILRGLVELGYGVSWRVLDAQYFGVPQRRRRVFIVGSLGNGGSAQVLFEREGGARNTPPRREAGQGVAAAVVSRIGKGGFTDPVNDNIISVHETGKGFWTEGLPGLRADPGGMPENVIAYTIQQNDNGNHRRKDRPNGGLYVNETDTALTVGSADMTAIAWMDSRRDSYREFGNIAPTAESQWGTGGNNVPLVGVRRLTPVECERLQGFPDNWTDGQADSTRYRQLGNAVAVPVIEWIGERITQVRGSPINAAILESQRCQASGIRQYERASVRRRGE